MRGSDAPFLLPLGSFPANPQYRVTVTDPDDDGDNLCTVIVGLMQKDRRKKREQGLDMLTIGYSIYKVCDPPSPQHVLYWRKDNSELCVQCFSKLFT